MKLADANLQGGSLVKFEVQCYRSREYLSESESKQQQQQQQQDDEKEATVYVMRLKRLEGTALNFNRIKRVIIFERCASVLTGLPKEIGSESLKQPNGTETFIDEADDDDDEEESDYDQILAQDKENDPLNN